MTASTEYTAQISTHHSGGWRLYVALMGVPVSQWPEHDFGPAAVVPTLAERSRALTGLGFAGAEGARWEWEEYSETPDDASAVGLLASIRVWSRGGGRW